MEKIQDIISNAIVVNSYYANGELTIGAQLWNIFSKGIVISDVNIFEKPEDNFWCLANNATGSFAYLVNSFLTAGTLQVSTVDNGFQTQIAGYAADFAAVDPGINMLEICNDATSRVASILGIFENVVNDYVYSLNDRVTLFTNISNSGICIYYSTVKKTITIASLETLMKQIEAYVATELLPTSFVLNSMTTYVPPAV